MKYQKILILGSLIKNQGGKLTTGLTNVIWNLAKQLSNKEDLKVYLFATDFYHNHKQVDNLEILGWQLKDVLRYILTNPIQTLRFLSYSYKILVHYRLKFFRTFIYLIIFKNVIKNTKPDILHIHGTNYIYFHFLLEQKELPIIITIHGINGIDPNIKNYQKQRKIEKIITNLTFEKIVFISTNLREDWIKIYGQPKSSTSVIINAFDNEIFKYDASIFQENHTRIRISTIARVYPLKGQERVIEALIQLAANDLFEYHIVGKGDFAYVKRLKDRAVKNNLEVFFHGEMTPIQVAKFLQTTDYMILPSSSEGFGLAILESIATGTKVIIPRTLPICKEPGILNDHNSIFIQDSTVHSIKEGLSFLIMSEKNNYPKYKVSATMKNISWINIAEEYFNLIKNLNL